MVSTFLIDRFDSISIWPTMGHAVACSSHLYLNRPGTWSSLNVGRYGDSLRKHTLHACLSWLNILAIACLELPAVRIVNLVSFSRLLTCSHTSYSWPAQSAQALPRHHRRSIPKYLLRSAGTSLSSYLILRRGSMLQWYVRQLRRFRHLSLRLRLQFELTVSLCLPGVRIFDSILHLPQIVRRQARHALESLLVPLLAACPH